MSVASIASSELYTFVLDINIDSLILHCNYATTIAFVVLAMSETSWKFIQVEFKKVTKSLIIYYARLTRGKGGSRKKKQKYIFCRNIV